MNHQEKIDWIGKRHRDTNHFYDEYLPYEFHLRMVLEVGKRFKHLIAEADYEEVELANYGHDLIEDTRTSYNDVRKVLGYSVAEAILACTDRWGRNRKERKSPEYYAFIRNTPYAVFVKLCDRIANVQYSKITGNSKKFLMYKEENPDFVMSLHRGYPTVHPFKEMFEYLESLFVEK